MSRTAMHGPFIIKAKFSQKHTRIQTLTSHYLNMGHMETSSFMKVGELILHYFFYHL